jgi:hypothetical protein
MRVPDSFQRSFAQLLCDIMLMLIPRFLSPSFPIVLTRLHRSPWFALSAVTHTGEIHDEDLPPWHQRRRAYLRPGSPRSGMDVRRYLAEFPFTSVFINHN